MLLLMMTMLLMMMMVTATAAAFLVMLVTIMMIRVVCNSCQYEGCGYDYHFQRAPDPAHHQVLGLQQLSQKGILLIATRNNSINHYVPIL